MAWRTLHHQNVLPLLGVIMTEDRFAMVSDWMAKGNINEFLKVEVSPDRLGLVCFRSRPLSLLFADDHLIAVAWRCNSGVNIYA